MKAQMKRVAWAVGLAAVFSVIIPAPAGNTNAGAARVPGKVEKANSIVGRELRDASNQPIARITELVVELESGRMLYAVASIGTGEKTDRLVAIPPGAFRAGNHEAPVVSDRRKLLEAPQYFPGDARRAEMESPAFVMTVYKWLGECTWWEPGADPAEFVSVFKTSELVGMDVRDMSGEKIGDVENVMIDLSSGRVPYIILAPDRALGLLNNNLYALPPNSVVAASDWKSLNTSIDRDKLAAAPRFDKNHWPDMSNPNWATRVYQTFGKQAFFEDGALMPTSRRTNSPSRIYHEPEKSKP